jgi:TRAP transporter 4TM/12TM fusion protein
MREPWSTSLTLGSLLAIGWSLLQFYVGYDGTFPTMAVRPWHVTLAAAVAFASVPLLGSRIGGEKYVPFGVLSRADKFLSVVLISASILIGAYFATNGQRLELRTPFVDELATMDIIVGSLLIILVLDATRRVTGLALPIVCVIFLIYNVVGPWMPGDLRHSGINLHDFIELQTMSTQGIFGVPVGVSSTYVFYFILFAAFMEASGGGALFINFALIATGRRRGGGAKAAVVGSGLFGMISGSAIANVTGSGIFTIPLMKRVGYSGTFAAAVEALASTGGQIMPPLMGAGAFIMAQMLGRQYSDIALAAAIPALLYFVSAYFMVDLQARKTNIQALTRDEIPKLRDCLKRTHLLIPMVYLVYGILGGASLMMAALQSILLIIAVSFLNRSTWFTPRKLVSALANGGRGAVAVALPCATAGMVVGVTVQSGLGLKFSGLIVSLAGGELHFALVLVMIGCIIMGMGLPTTAAYILAAVLMVPSLTSLGVNELAAHMFVFYFACISMITPPVALASYAASAIAGSPMGATGWTAFKIGMAGYLVPYAFVFGPALVLEGDWFDTVIQLSTALIGVYALSGAVIGFLRRKNRQWESLLLLACAIALITPNVVSGTVGFLGVSLVLWLQGRSAGEVRAPTSS